MPPARHTEEGLEGPLLCCGHSSRAGAGTQSCGTLGVAWLMACAAADAAGLKAWLRAVQAVSDSLCVIILCLRVFVRQFR